MKQELLLSDRRRKAIFPTVYSLRNQKNDFDDRAEREREQKIWNTEHKLHNLIFVFSPRRIFKIFLL